MKHESISMERLDGETILINFDTGQYFSFYGSAADILWLVDAKIDRTYWAGVAEAAFPGLAWDTTVDTQVDEFLAGLVDVGVVTRSEEAGGPAAPLPDDYVRGHWAAPSVFGNDDLADLLIIDPIHEASEDGWPQTRPS